MRSEKQTLCPIWKAKITKEMRDKILTDESISLAQNLSAKQPPRISKSMDAFLRKMHESELIPVVKPYIQLLYAGSID